MKSACLFFALLVSAAAFAQTYRTEAYSDRVKTLRVSPVDDWSAAPCISLGDGGAVDISFDLLGADPGQFTYTLTHCDADWRPSVLVDAEFMEGFQYRPITDYAISLNTTMNYVNYRLEIPNDEVGIRISGNYAVHVFPADGSEPVLCACFSVVEPMNGVEMQVTAQTDRGINTAFQQVGFTIRCGDEVKTPMQDLKVYVMQNERSDNCAALVRPLRVENRTLYYEHNPALIFEAGNEYRRFEMTTRRFSGLNIASIDYHEPYYHVALDPGRFRSADPYSYYEDIDGRFFVRTLDGDNADWEADYYLVHFLLLAPHPLREDVYILSRAFNNILDDRSRMEYSEADGGYVKTAILKEGYYNYLYLARASADSPASAMPVEGSHYQTENEYRVMVYFRRPGDRYDRLTATATLQFK
jgi:hypothetical protein